MNILITGGAGFLGRTLAHALLQRGQLAGQPITALMLADLVAPNEPALTRNPRVQVHTGDLLTSLPTPQSSYGIHKFVCEQLVADHTRKGFLDGRAARLMTVSVRPGRPNGAASSFLSGLLREPLAGQPSN